MNIRSKNISIIWGCKYYKCINIYDVSIICARVFSNGSNKTTGQSRRRVAAGHVGKDRTKQAQRLHVYIIDHYGNSQRNEEHPPRGGGTYSREKVRMISVLRLCSSHFPRVLLKALA